MKKIYLLGALLFSALSFGQTTITDWNFDASTTAPSTGVGTASAIGGAVIVAAYPTGNPASGKGLSINTFPAAGTASGTAGFKFAVSTVGYNGITVTFDPRGSNSCSKFQQYEYTTDGTTWTILSNNAGGLTIAFTATPMVTLNFPAICNNQANFAFRIVSIFDPAGTDYVAVTTGTAYSPSTGAWRIDNVKFTGTVSLGIQQNEISGLRLFPNPAKDFLYISSDNAEAKQLTIYDVVGKVVINTKVTNGAVNVSALNRGVYMAKVIQEGKTASRKLVIE
jgi:Secretion system C-terminal sorting domain